MAPLDYSSRAFYYNKEQAAAAGGTGNMIRIAIVEDDPIYQRQLRGYLQQYGQAQGEQFQITSFDTGHAIAYHYDADYDIILMDIELGAVSGMEAAEIIRTMDRDVVIIFITNSPQYAIEGYKVEALDYVLKPISYYAFSQRLARAIERMGKLKRQYIRVNISRGRVKKLDVSSIYYVEVREHILIYHTKEGEITVSGSMREAEKALEGKGFFRCNKGYLINLEHVEGFRDDMALVGGDQVQISRAKRKPFLDALNNYLGEVGT